MSIWQKTEQLYGGLPGDDSSCIESHWSSYH